MTATDDWTVTKPVRTAPAACFSRSGMNRHVKNRPVMNRPQDEPTVLSRPVMNRPVMKRPGIRNVVKKLDNLLPLEKSRYYIDDSEELSVLMMIMILS